MRLIIILISLVAILLAGCTLQDFEDFFDRLSEEPIPTETNCRETFEGTNAKCFNITTEQECKDFGDCWWTDCVPILKGENKECYYNILENACKDDANCLWTKEKIHEEPEEPEEELGFSFEYDEFYNNGYYSVPCAWVPDDKLEYCPYCMGEVAQCGSGRIDNRDLYTINDGYEENFTYESDYPIYGAWEIRNFNDFTSKCFVGDCNKLNSRHVICINEDSAPTIETFECEKWFSDAGSRTGTRFCTDEGYIRIYNNYTIKFDAKCKKNKVLKFIYVYNEWDGYEGYSSDWKERWLLQAHAAQEKFNEYGIHFDIFFEEIKLSSDVTIPSAIYNFKRNAPYNDSEVYITILAGLENPGKYNVSCPTHEDYPYNPCSANSGIRIPDYYSIKTNTYRTIIHELGHKFGLPHTGAGGSLTSHLYMEDIMSYGSNTDDFKYESRIALWLIGQHGE